MTFGTIKKLITSEYREFNDTILVESPFRETTRDSKDVLRLVQLGHEEAYFVMLFSQVTQTKILICALGAVPCALVHAHSRVVKASSIRHVPEIFKSYNAIGNILLQIFWCIWRHNIKELNSSYKKWPFTIMSNTNVKNCNHETPEKRLAECIELRFIKRTEKREAEDKIRPVPLPGLGRAEEIKLLYLKPRYFGCWEQSEHWVQCGDSSLDVIK
ncbi:hypothetical protein HF086_014496 [Spodoptera exigua]|uniref:Uncharacterized protein n=1 Tax=Spodoptera exigua TaxID=7107 RepID=A0A922SJS6_SPOEX|nr:hypothetical protein HF086_014496 [Spodoptera exigua]